MGVCESTYVCISMCVCGRCLRGYMCDRGTSVWVWSYEYACVGVGGGVCRYDNKCVIVYVCVFTCTLSIFYV